MAEFKFSMRGYVFQQGLKDLRRAFDATMQAVHTAHENAQADWLRDRTGIEAGELSANVYEDDYFLYSRETLHKLLIEQAAAAIPVAINAYVVMLHHYWERSVDHWRNAKNNYKHTREYDWLESKGLTIDREGLEFLRKATNTIKHNNSELHAERPELFRMGAGNAIRSDYAAGLSLADKDFIRLLEAVQLSGFDIASDFDFGSQ